MKFTTKQIKAILFAVERYKRGVTSPAELAAEIRKVIGE